MYVHVFRMPLYDGSGHASMHKYLSVLYPLLHISHSLPLTSPLLSSSHIFCSSPPLPPYPFSSNSHSLSWPFIYISNTNPIHLYFKPPLPATRLSKLSSSSFSCLSIISIPSSATY